MVQRAAGENPRLETKTKTRSLRREAPTIAALTPSARRPLPGGSAFRSMTSTRGHTRPEAWTAIDTAPIEVSRVGTCPKMISPNLSTPARRRSKSLT